MPDQKQIAEWKKKYGDVYHIEFDDAECWLRKPSRGTVAMAMTKSRTNPLDGVAVLLESCWLAGDEKIKEDAGYQVGLLEKTDLIIGTKSAEVKNC
jgi:hypothetical protein